MRHATVGGELGLPRSVGNEEWPFEGWSAATLGSFYTWPDPNDAGDPYLRDNISQQVGRTGGKCLRFASQADSNPGYPRCAVGRIMPRSEDWLPGSSSSPPVVNYAGVVFRGYLRVPLDSAYPRTGVRTEVLALALTRFGVNTYYDDITKPLMSVMLDDLGRLSVRHKRADSSAEQQEYYPAWRSEPLVKGDWYRVEALVTWGVGGPDGAGKNITALRIDGEIVWSQCVDRSGQYNMSAPCAFVGWGHTRGESSVSPQTGPGAGLLIDWDDMGVNDLVEHPDQPASDVQTTWLGPGRVLDRRPTDTLYTNPDSLYGWARGGYESYYGGYMNGSNDIVDSRIYPQCDTYPDDQTLLRVIDILAPADYRYHLSLQATFDEIRALPNPVYDFDPDDLHSGVGGIGWAARDGLLFTHGASDAWFGAMVAGERPPLYTKPWEVTYGPRADVLYPRILTARDEHEHLIGPIPEGGPDPVVTFTFRYPVDDVEDAAIMFAAMYWESKGTDTADPADRDGTFVDGDPVILDLPTFADNLNRKVEDGPFALDHRFTGFGDADESVGTIVLSPEVYNPAMPVDNTVSVRFERLNPNRAYGRNPYFGMGHASFGLGALVIEDGYEEQPPLPGCPVPPTVVPGDITTGPQSRGVRQRRRLAAGRQVPQ